MAHWRYLHFLDQLTQALGGMGGGLQPRAGQQQQKLLATHAAGQVIDTRDLAHGACELSEYLVTCIVAKTVVDMLEVIDVDGNHRERQRLRLKGADGCLQMAAIAQPGQRIGVHVLAQLGDIALQQAQTLEHGFLEFVGLEVPGLDGLDVLRRLGLVHIVSTIGELA